MRIPRIETRELKYLVEFELCTESDDGYCTKLWQKDFGKRVNISTGLAKEIEQSGQVFGEATHTIKCRYSPKITADHRIKYKNTIFEIIGKPINVDMANKVTLITVKEITDA